MQVKTPSVDGGGARIAADEAEGRTDDAAG
jgi:hypothetical protein